jgi:tetratricopeptide (TPR) repeat protein
VNADTSYDGKMELMTKAADFAKKVGNNEANANWMEAIYKAKKKTSNTDLYNLGFAYYRSKNYAKSDSIFTSYIDKYPNEIFGYLWTARSKQALDDSTNSKGLAVDAYKTLLDKAATIDSVKYKSQILSSCFFLIQYYNDIKKDKPTAISYCDRILQTDPANADAIRIKDILSRAPAAKPAGPAAKPKTGAAKPTSKAKPKKNSNLELV